MDNTFHQLFPNNFCHPIKNLVKISITYIALYRVILSQLLFDINIVIRKSFLIRYCNPQCI